MVKQIPNKKEGRGQRRSEYKKEPQEYDQKVLDIARVARVVAGGRRFSFRAVVVVGNRKGKVGVGVAKGGDVSVAINKATTQANKKVLEVPMTKSGTLPYEVQGKQTSSVVLLKPGVKGRGIVAGGAVRTICDLAGYKDISAKILSRSTNKLNNAIATINALKKIKYTSQKHVSAVALPVRRSLDAGGAKKEGNKKIKTLKK